MALQTFESKEILPILIVDRNGSIGQQLSKKLSESSTVVLATQKPTPNLENVIYVPYLKRIPKIPDNIYSHIFVIDDGEDITIEALSSFLKKAQEDKAIFSFCTTLGRNKLPPEIFEYRKSKILYLGDVFPQSGLFAKSYVNRFLISAKNRGRIEVPQDGMTLSYPIFFEDAISGILEASFGTSNDRIYYILPKYGVTLLTLAHTIQKKDPTVKIDFSHDEPRPSPKIPQRGKFLFDEKYPLAERIMNLTLTFGKSEERKFESLHKKFTFYSTENLRLVSFAILFFLFLPLITTLLFSFLGLILLDSSKASVGSSRSQVRLARTSFNLATSFSKALLYETSFLKIDPLAKLVEGVEKEKTKAESIFGYYDSLDLFSQGKTSEAISRIKDFLVFTQTENKLKIVEGDVINFISQTINVWPQVLGVEAEKNYLILFQNNFILRGSGGKIESFGTLILENGKISDFTIYNPYDLDKNLKGHVEPPFALRRYLPSPNFHLMDASFDADFRQVAQNSSFFVDLEAGKKVDGVISVNSKTLDRLLEKSNTKKNDNFTETASLLRKNLQGKNLAKILLSKEFVNLVQSKDIIFYFNDKSIENIFLTNSFSSALVTQREDTPKQINDFLSLMQTDIQGSSSTKMLSQRVKLKENGEIVSTITVELDNSRDVDSRKYLRIIQPQGAVLRKIVIDNEEKDFSDAVTSPEVYEAKDFKPPQTLEVERLAQGGKEIFGFLTKVPKRKIQNIEVTFSLQSKPLSSLSDFSFNLHFFKQPGAEPYQFKFSMDFPRSFKIYSNPNITKTTDRDFDLTFNFTK